MIKRKVKLSRKKRRGTIKIKDMLRIFPSLQHFEPISEIQKEQNRKEIESFKEKIRELNITEEMRKKKASELTKKEKDKLYDEYVYNSIIKSLLSMNKFGVCEFKYLVEELIEEGLVSKKWKNKF